MLTTVVRRECRSGAVGEWEVVCVMRVATLSNEGGGRVPAYVTPQK